ncbi:MAG: DUF2085 domain-containing protein [archaeon]|jgi:uncharacterized membrane protein
MNLCFCHQLPERSFFIKGKQFPLCARCVGQLIGAIVGFVLIGIEILIPATISGILIVPLLIDGFSQLFGLRQSNNSLRFLTGILFGIGFTMLSYLGSKLFLAIVKVSVL